MAAQYPITLRFSKSTVILRLGYSQDAMVLLFILMKKPEKSDSNLPLMKNTLQNQTSLI